MIELSNKTKKLLEALYPDANRIELADLLIGECGSNLAFSDGSPEGMERIRFAVLKRGNGSVERFLDAIELAQLDWRDLLMIAGFGEDLGAHDAWYLTVIED